MTLDHQSRMRPWGELTEREQAALLADLGRSLRQRLLYLEMDQTLAQKYRALARASVQTGQAMLRKMREPSFDVPRWSWGELPLETVREKSREIGTWASATVNERENPPALTHAALDLRDAAWDLERTRERTRSR